MSVLNALETATVTVCFAAVVVTIVPQPVAAAQALSYQIVPEESEARYRVRERLARLEFPNDAVGTTRSISGQIVLDESGLVASASNFEVDLRTLKSDRDRRDSYLQRNTLETEQFPFMTFVPTVIHGFRSPVPTSGTYAFRLLGQTTLHGVTREAIWDVELEFSAGGARGTATTHFTFGDYNLKVPKMAALLSVTDYIALELDIVLVAIAEGP